MIRQVREQLAEMASGWSLARRFALAGSIVMLAAMVLIGNWVTSKITENAIGTSSTATALFMDSFIAPLTQELQESDTLSIGPIRALQEMMDSASLKERVVSIKIWKPEGLIAFATDIELIGKRFPVTDGLQSAFAGNVMGELDHLEDEESTTERERGIPLLEIYSPIREEWTGRVIAVAEFYERADILDAEIARARVQSWFAVAAVTAIIALALFGIVNRGSRRIENQALALKAQIAHANRMSEENRALRLRAERAAGKVSELTESYLRRVSADLHDGPAQLIALASLRLGSLRKSTSGSEETVAAMEKLLQEAIAEIRTISRGLSLPELEKSGLQDVAKRAIASHESRTGHEIESTLRLDGYKGTMAVKTCLYRFLQEGLNNAWVHAPGAKVTVSAAVEESRLTVLVENGHAIESPQTKEQGGMGLSGLKERIESLGGMFGFTMGPEKGACLSMQLEIDGEVLDA